MTPIGTILVATDFSDCSGAAVATAVELATLMRARLTVVHVCETTPATSIGAEYAMVDLTGPFEEASRRELEEEVARLRAVLPAVEGELRTGMAWEQILAVAAERKADLIVVGTHGRTGFTHALLGSVAEKLLRMSPVLVLTVPHGKALPVVYPKSA